MQPPDGTMDYLAKTNLYSLLPVWIGKSQRVYVTHALMWDKDGEFKGTWMRTNMPLKLIWQLQAHIRWLEMLGWKSDGENTIAPGE